MSNSSYLKLVIFDLDETIQYNSVSHVPNHVHGILRFFKDNEIPMAIASLNTRAKDMLQYHKIEKYFSAVEARKNPNNIRSRSDFEEHAQLTKFYMLRRLLKKFYCKPKEVLFFDDAQRNIDCARLMGIHSVKVDPAFCIRWKNVFQGLDMAHIYPIRRRTI